MNHKNHWTAAEDEILRSMWRDTPMEELVEALGRSPSSIRKRGQWLRIGEKTSNSLTTAGRVRECREMLAECRYAIRHSKSKHVRSAARSVIMRVTERLEILKRKKGL